MSLTVRSNQSYAGSIRRTPLSSRVPNRLRGGVAASGSCKAPTELQREICAFGGFVVPQERPCGNHHRRWIPPLVELLEQHVRRVSADSRQSGPAVRVHRHRRSSMKRSAEDQVERRPVEGPRTARPTIRDLANDMEQTDAPAHTSSPASRSHRSAATGTSPSSVSKQDDVLVPVVGLGREPDLTPLPAEKRNHVRVLAGSPDTRDCTRRIASARQVPLRRR